MPSFSYVCFPSFRVDIQEKILSHLVVPDWFTALFECQILGVGVQEA